MPLYQKSVLNKYLKGLNAQKVSDAYEKFMHHFHNAIIQENIRNSKEEQYQGEFLIDLFVNVLGYTKNPTPDFNLTTELKNIKGSKKTDGAILKGDTALAVIELKGTNTTDLNKVEVQAFGYKNNQPGCTYVITSNFEKLRFYIDNAVDFEEFDLFQLSKERFDILWLCLSSEYLLKDIPKKIKDESLTQEEEITKKLYRDYSTFRTEVFQNLVAQNPQHKPITLFKKTQKLLDRFLFIFFAEDRLLLPPNSIRSIITQWKELRDNYDEYFTLYSRFKKYFGYLNTGHKGKQHDIFAYNGGLFAPDTILDTVEIDDELLFKHTQKLSNFDFESEVSVNILGHIFEHSLTELENIQAELEGQPVEKSKTKRKKDGVFYTPKYITKYIVENTVGKLCEEKKDELEITDEKYQPTKQRSRKRLENLQAYRDWLLQLTICDPACGSGAFLNQALEFLIAEHRYIDELSAKYNKDALVLSDIENAILENNLFGVDINEESVEIAKLSLWLRTAQKGRKLTSLNNNIKCGNSLIDDPNVAGDKAFNWQTEFPEVFNPSLRANSKQSIKKESGFDVVIGNPPYVRSRELFSLEEKEYFIENYETTSYQLDLYKLFIEKSCSLINEKGKLSFITPSVFLTNDYDRPLRKFIIDRYSLEILASSDKDIFEDASVKTVTFVISNLKRNNVISFYRIHDSEFYLEKRIDQKVFVEQDYLINERINISSIPIINKLNKFERLGSYYDVKNGIKVRKDLLYDFKKDDDHKRFILGKNITSYCISFDNLFIDYKPQNEKKFTNQAFRTKEIFEQEKLIIRQILGKRILSSFDDQNYFTDQTTYIINKINPNHNLKFLLCILNSRLIYYYFINTFSDNKITFPKVKRSQLLELPYNSKANQTFLIEKANKIMKLAVLYSTFNFNFLKYFQSRFVLDKLSKKLQNWHELNFGEFLKELEKAHKKAAKENDTTYTKLSLSEEAEWMQYFNEQKEKALQLKAEIDKTDREIDAMVYDLYGLTEEEIKIVEEATK